MSLAAKAAAVAAVTALVAGGLSVLQPKTLEQQRQERLQQQWEQLADADEQSKERLRRRGEDLQRADARDRLRPAERRPRPVDPPRVRLRLP